MVRSFRAFAWLPLAALLVVSLPGSALATRGAAGTRSQTHSPKARSLTASTTAALDSGVLDRLNATRLEHGLAPLVLNGKLTEAALQHTRDMVAKGYFAHDSADGTPFWKRIQAYYPSGAFRYWSVGENILWTAGSESPGAAMRSWMASPEHRQNILDPGWRQIGIAAMTSTDARGTFGGHSVTVITTDFGVRRGG